MEYFYMLVETYTVVEDLPVAGGAQSHRQRLQKLDVDIHRLALRDVSAIDYVVQFWPTQKEHDLPVEP